MKNITKFLLLMSLSCVAMWAQATAQIHGAVTDMTGSGVPGANVKATQTETGVTRTITTEADGGYVLANLPIGPYTVEITKDGFTTYVQSGIVLQVGSDPNVIASLKVGAVSERVNVEANASQVETRSVGVGNVIENQRVIELPLNGRQPTDLVTLSGAAVQTSASRGFGMRTGVLISVAGGNTGGVQYYMDGAPHSNLFDGSGLPLPFPDAMQEFKISTSTQDAASSGHSGAAVSAVMKSGTNSLHGDMFYFLRNYAVNARDFFAKAQDGLKRNQFGGVLGGPIKKDKLFFFMGYQGTLVRQTPIANTTFVPTDDMLKGDFRTFAACNGRTLSAPFGTNGFAANMIDPALFSPAAVKIAQRLPKALDGCGTYLTGNPLSENDHEVNTRVDYQMSEKQTLFGRYMLVKQDIAVPYSLAPNDVLTAGGIGSNDQFNSFALGDTYLLSPTSVNSFRVSFNRVRAIKPGAQMFSNKDVGINTYTYQPNYLTIPVNGAFSLGSGNFSQNSFAYTTMFGVNDDINMVRGSHQIAFGGFFTRSIEWSVAQAWSGGSYSIGNTLGLGMADFFLGVVSQYRQANPNPLNIRQNFAGMYAQDTWKITPKLTMTYGIAWNPFFGMNFPQGDVYNFSLGGFYAGKTSSAIKGAPAGFTFPGDPGFAGKSGINSQWGLFNPRIGLAWDPFGDGKTAIRLGAGIANDYIEQDLHLNTSSSLPFRLTVVQTGGLDSTTLKPTLSLDNPFPGGSPFPYSFNPTNPSYPTAATAPCLVSTCPPTFLPVPANMKTHKQYSWNLGIQRQVTQSLFVSATYMGTHIIHIWNAVELNPAQYIPGNCAAGQYGLRSAGACTQASNVTQRRVLNLANPSAAPLGYLTSYDDGGTQGYNGVLLNANWRNKSGLSLQANYTLSHCIGLQTITLLNPGANYIHGGYGQNIGAADRNLDVGDCLQDRRHIGNITVVYQTPKYENHMTRMLASGWTLGSALVMRTGAPLTVVTGVLQDPATGFGGNSPGTQRPNQLLEDTSSSTRGQSCGAPGAFCKSWLNRNAFAAPALGTFGNMGYNAVRGPGFWQWDQSVSRQFAVHEGQRMEIRAEAFNLTNSLRPGNPGVNWGAPNTFGLITADATPPAATTAPARVLQFALKYVF
ncbi:MAG: carboxypeptidase-like regulatory domain-containing protein [Bryobacteraceae bacterium]